MAEPTTAWWSWIIPRLGLAAGPPKVEPPLAERAWELLAELGYNNHAGLETSGEVAFVRRLAAAGRNGAAFDVGAHDGRYSRLLADQGFRSVHMIEPHPVHTEALEALAASTGYVRLGVAASDRDGSAELRFDPDDLQLASLCHETDQLWFVRNDESVRVPTRTLDAIWNEAGEPDLDLLKVDVEGWEQEVLAGAENLLASSPPAFIQVEVNQHHLLRGQSLLSLSRQLPGDRLCFQLLPRDGGVRPVSVLDPLSNVFAFANFVFVDPDQAHVLTG